MDKVQRVLDLTKLYYDTESKLADIRTQIAALLNAGQRPVSGSLSPERIAGAAASSIGTATERALVVFNKHAGKELSMEQLRGELQGVHHKTLTATVSRLSASGKIKNVGRGRYIREMSKES